MSLQNDLAGFKQRMSMLDPNKPITASDANVIADLLIKLAATSGGVEFILSDPGVVNNTNKITIIQNSQSITWEAEVAPV